jgi:hypothetical protein
MSVDCSGRRKPQKLNLNMSTPTRPHFKLLSLCEATQTPSPDSEFEVKTYRAFCSVVLSGLGKRIFQATEKMKSEESLEIFYLSCNSMFWKFVVGDSDFFFF